jgi:hypothetical protein
MCAVFLNQLAGLQLQWNLGSRMPLFTNNSVQEQFFRAKNVSDDERCLGLGTRKLATAASWEYRRRSVSCWLTLAQYTSLLVFAVPALEFHCVLCCFLNILLNKTKDQRRKMIAKLNEVFVYIYIWLVLCSSFFVLDLVIFIGFVYEFVYKVL